MRYSKDMLRSSLVIAMCAGVCGCATAQGAGSPGALEQALADDDDLGDPRGTAEEREAAAAEREQAQAQAMLDDPDAERMTFDGDEANDAPVDRVMIPPDRSPSRSMIQDITMGPSS